MPCRLTVVMGCGDRARGDEVSPQLVEVLQAAEKEDLQAAPRHHDIVSGNPPVPRPPLQFDAPPLNCFDVAIPTRLRERRAFAFLLHPPIGE